MSQRVVIQTVLDRPDAVKLRAKAEAEATSVSAIVRKALRDALRDMPKAA